MGLPVLIMGESGSGKSTSLRNFAPEDISIFNVAGKLLPFKKKLATAKTSDYNVIKGGMHSSAKKSFAIDDSQYLLSFALFNKAKEPGYGKFTDMAVEFKNLITFVLDYLPADVIVYFLHHIETTTNGKIKAKTIGKMLDDQLTVEGLFTIVLLCTTDGQSHKFITQSDGNTTAKSPCDFDENDKPIPMFELEIDNDLKMVDKTIREYYKI